MSRVLVIDDDESVCRGLVRALKGHTVETMLDPVAAVKRLINAQSIEFDVIMCDVSMPVLDGMEIYRRVLEARPELIARFLFVSGNGGQRDYEFLERPDIRSLRKPFDLNELRRAIDELCSKEG